jgi:hypothetical protein
MTEVNEEVRRLLKNAIRPVNKPELEHDLWPRMLKKLDEQATLRLSWFDWVLAAALVVSCVLFPGVLPGLFYNL